MGVAAPLGAAVSAEGTRFAVWSGAAERVRLCLFDGDTETDRLDLAPEGEGVHALFVPGVSAGTRYGFRADGDGCFVDFSVDFAFKNRVFEMMAGQVFAAALRKMIGAFEDRAAALYGAVGASGEGGISRSSAHSAA